MKRIWDDVRHTTEGKILALVAALALLLMGGEGVAFAELPNHNTIGGVATVLSSLVLGAVVVASLMLLAMDETSRPVTTEKFCVDCGKAMVQAERQVGFNGHSGKPSLKVTLACPDWEDPRKSAMIGSSNYSAFGPPDQYEPGRCHKRVTTDWAMPTAHSCTVQMFNKDVACKGCRAWMVANKVISEADAQLLAAS